MEEVRILFQNKRKHKLVKVFITLGVLCITGILIYLGGNEKKVPSVKDMAKVSDVIETKAPEATERPFDDYTDEELDEFKDEDWAGHVGSDRYMRYIENKAEEAPQNEQTWNAEKSACGYSLEEFKGKAKEKWGSKIDSCEGGDTFYDDGCGNPYIMFKSKKWIYSVTWLISYDEFFFEKSVNAAS